MNVVDNLIRNLTQFESTQSEFVRESYGRNSLDLLSSSTQQPTYRYGRWRGDEAYRYALSFCPNSIRSENIDMLGPHWEHIDMFNPTAPISFIAYRYASSKVGEHIDMLSPLFTRVVGAYRYAGSMGAEHIDILSPLPRFGTGTYRYGGRGGHMLGHIDMSLM